VGVCFVTFRARAFSYLFIEGIPTQGYDHDSSSVEFGIEFCEIGSLVRLLSYIFM